MIASALLPDVVEVLPFEGVSGGGSFVFEAPITVNVRLEFSSKSVVSSNGSVRQSEAKAFLKPGLSVPRLSKVNTADESYTVLATETFKDLRGLTHTVLTLGRDDQ